MPCGNTSQLINVKSFRKTPCVPFANQSSTQLHLHCMPAGWPMVTVCLLLGRLHFFCAAGCCNRLLAFFLSPDQQINIPIALYVGRYSKEEYLLVSCRREDHHDGQLRDLQGSLFSVFVARDR